MNTSLLKICAYPYPFLGILAAVVAVNASAEVTMTGLEGALLDNALIHLTLDDESCDALEWRIRERYSRAGDEIRASLEAYGYYSVSVRSELEFAESCWNARFFIDLGEPVRLREVDISIRGEAADDPGFARLVDASLLTPGEILQHAAYEQLKRRLIALAQERGYAEASLVANQIDVYPEVRAADIALEFDSGPRYVFGEVEFTQEVLNQSLLERYFEFRRGDPYDRSRLTALYGALTNSGYFNSVDVRPLPGDAVTREIPISIGLTGVRRRAINYGIGFSTDTGPRLRFGRLNRRVDMRGTQSSVNGQISPVISEVAYNRRFPYGDPRTEWVSFDVGIKHEKTDTAVSDTLELGMHRVITTRGRWQETQFIDLTIEDFIVGDIESRSRLLTPGVGWFKVEADNTLRPSRGYRLGLDLSGASDSLGSDTTFGRVQASAKWIGSFRRDSRLLLRARLGFIQTSDFSELPPSIRFFAGGDNSIRGFNFESLGPVDENGDVIGGDRIAVGSIEYEVPFSPRWSGAVFIDSGNAFTGSDFDARTGAGVGIRWRSPLGPIRFDIAWPVNDIEESPRLHVSLGADL
jgi:translocation and assembly module TamA